MSDSDRKPGLDWDASNLAEAFKMYKEQCNLYFTIHEVKREKQAHHIVYYAGQEGIKRSQTWKLTAEQMKDPDLVWTKFDEEIVKPSQNFRVSRLWLRKYRQKSDESIDDFVARCKSLAFQCQFRDDQELEERIIEQIIDGTPHTEVQKSLLGKDSTLTLASTIDEVRTHEASILHMKQLQDSQTAPAVVHELKKSPNACYYCGGDHNRRSKCPAYGTFCAKCGKRNHWARVCKSKSTSGQIPHQSSNTSQNRRGRSMSRQRRYAGRRSRSPSPHGKRNERSTVQVQSFANEPYDEPYTSQHDYDNQQFYSIQVSSMEYETDINYIRDTHDEAYATVDIDIQRNSHTSLKVKVDTGAQGNTLPIRIYRRMFPNNLDSTGYPKAGTLRPNTSVLTAYNNTRIEHYGTVIIPCKHKDTSWRDIAFFVVNVDGPAILGLPDCKTLNIITLNCNVNTTQPINSTAELMAAYPKCFDTIGNFKGEYHIVLRDNATPMIHAPRTIPIHVKDDIEAELQDMLAQGVLKKVEQPTDWVNSITWSLKSNGRWRVCLDPKNLNDAIMRPIHKVPTLEEIQHKFAGSQIFSKLDAKSGYWSVHLDAESQLLTTFNSPLGRLCFTRMPFGLCMSQDVFQHRMDQILDRVGPGVVGIADDVAVHAATPEEHDKILHRLMAVASEEGLVFNSDKCHIKCDSIQFYGLIYDKHGVHADPAKAEDIRSLAPPTNKDELHHFLGLVTYMGSFIPRLSAQTACLRDLLKKDVDFVWNASHQAAYDNVKQLICETTTLTYFDPNTETILQVDASMTGLGAVLVQQNRPVAFASKSLTACESRYANIEREMLAVVFGIKRFHNYIYGKPFVVESDHKPLEMIALKNIGAAPPRLQRMLLSVQGYNFKIRYKPGRELLLADPISRLPSTHCEQLPLDVRVEHLQFSNNSIDNIRRATSQDPVLSALMELVHIGWPEKLHQVSKPLRCFWSYRDEISMENGILLKGVRIIIPKVLQPDILQQLHSAHQGVTKTQLLARNHVYWYGIDTDIDTLVKGCAACNKYAHAQSHETLLQHEVPSGPWQSLATDLFHFDGTEYLVLVDYYTKFPIVRKMGNAPTSKAVVNCLKQIFSEYGIPDILISDNGCQYASAYFADFATHYGFRHITSSPHYPRSNGFAERNVQIVKNVMKKCKDSGQDLELALLTLRMTPVDNKLPSPAEMLSGRKLKGLLPLRQTQNPDRDIIRTRLFERQDTQRRYHDTNKHELAPLVPGQLVSVRNTITGLWQPGKVVSQCVEPRSYVVETPNGSRLHRNCAHLRDMDSKCDNVPKFKRQVHFDTPDDVSPRVSATPHNTTQSHNTHSPVSSTSSEVYKTRSGRKVNKPSRYRDK